jgi:hypothetical protein
MRVTVRFNYVLVLEWLAADDSQTGSELHEFVRCLGFHSELVSCRTWEDIERALSAAAASVTAKGIPIVHLETHGSNPWAVDPENISLGPAGSTAIWSQLGPLLAPLNVAADFRLLVVSAACWGSGIMAAIEAGEHPAPFACALGLRTEVTEGRLRDAMRELYRSLNRGDDLDESVASAQRELVEGQALQLEVAVELAIKIVRTAYYRSKSPLAARLGAHRRRRRARRVWDSWFPVSLQERDEAYRFEVAGINR